MLRLQRSHLPIVESTCPKVACVYNERGTCDEPRISKGNSDAKCFRMSNRATLEMLGYSIVEGLPLNLSCVER